MCRTRRAGKTGQGTGAGKADFPAGRFPGEKGSRTGRAADRGRNRIDRAGGGRAFERAGMGSVREWPGETFPDAAGWGFFRRGCRGMNRSRRAVPAGFSGGFPQGGGWRQAAFSAGKKVFLSGPGRVEAKGTGVCPEADGFGRRPESGCPPKGCGKTEGTGGTGTGRKRSGSEGNGSPGGNGLPAGSGIACRIVPPEGA